MHIYYACINHRSNVCKVENIVLDNIHETKISLIRVFEFCKVGTIIFQQVKNL